MRFDCHVLALILVSVHELMMATWIKINTFPSRRPIIQSALLPPLSSSGLVAHNLTSHISHSTSHYVLGLPLPLSQLSLVENDTVHFPKPFHCTHKIAQSSGAHISCDEYDSSGLLKTNGNIFSILTDREMTRKRATCCCKLLECKITVGLVDLEHLESIRWDLLGKTRDSDIEKRSIS